MEDSTLNHGCVDNDTHEHDSSFRGHIGAAEPWLVPREGLGRIV